MNKITLLLNVAMIVGSAHAFADDSIIEGRIKIAQGDAGGPCRTGYMIEGIDLDQGTSINLCANVASNMNYGPILNHQIGTLTPRARKQAIGTPLEYFRRQGTMRFSGSAPTNDIEFTVFSAELIGE